MILAVIAAAFTFTATATGVEEGTPLEFMFAGNDTDRDYETMFLVDKSVAELSRDMEKSGLKRGRPVDQKTCMLWPIGCRITLNPSIENFVSIKMPGGIVTPQFIYTGGTRNKEGEPLAEGDMPRSFLAFYSLAQSLFVPNGIYEQGEVYGCFTARSKLEKGKQYQFTISWDENSMAKSLDIVFSHGNAETELNKLRDVAKNGEVDLNVSFNGEMTVEEAINVASSIAIIDSPSIKVNGCNGFFYRAFLPMTKWLDRKERLTQPFEINVGSDKVTYIEEDWTVEGNDPKLTPREISFADTLNYPKTDTCFIFAKKDTKLKDVLETKRKIKSNNVINWYVFKENNHSSHNAAYTGR